jgi:DNA-binding response OmpR family regulator
MSYNIIFIDESESLQRAVSAVFVDNPEFELTLVGEPSAVYKAAKNFIPDIIVLGYNTIDTELKKSITEIKTSKEFSNIPLILLVPSDLSDNERETLIKLKADGFIYRPFDKETFISKIKRTLNGSDTASDASGNSVKAENAAEKIYDIGAFEIKKTEENAAANAAPENTADTRDDNKEHENKGLESSELSQAFENLFKDDAIFKEFQNLNKKEEPDAPGGYIIEDTPTANIPDIELITAQNEAKDEEQAPSFVPYEEKAEPERQQEPGQIFADAPAEIFGRPETSQFNIAGEVSEPDNISKYDKPAGIFELNAPAETFESSVSLDSITLKTEHDKNVSDASSASDLDEPFSGFNIALGGDNEKAGEPGTYKLDMNINTNESKGELNLKILDEQNLVKLEDYLKNAVEKTIDDIKPQIIEAVKTSLPEIIEKLVKEEIEKIKQQ